MIGSRPWLLIRAVNQMNAILQTSFRRMHSVVGSLANAVMAGQGRQVFTVCLSRALGRSFHGSERQKKLLGSANDFHVGNTSARVLFNRDAQSAVSLVTDALRGSTRILELFRNLVNGTDQRSDTPLEMRNIDTLKMAFPFCRPTMISGFYCPARAV